MCQVHANGIRHSCTGRRTVATSILAAVSLGISQTKLKLPSSFCRGTSCQAEISLPSCCTNCLYSFVSAAPCNRHQSLNNCLNMQCCSVIEAYIAWGRGNYLFSCGKAALLWSSVKVLQDVDTIVCGLLALWGSVLCAQAISGKLKQLR